MYNIDIVFTYQKNYINKNVKIVLFEDLDIFWPKFQKYIFDKYDIVIKDLLHVASVLV